MEFAKSGYLQQKGYSFTPLIEEDSEYDELYSLFNEDDNNDDEYESLYSLMVDKREEYDEVKYNEIVTLLAYIGVKADISVITGATRDYYIIKPHGQGTAMVWTYRTKLIANKTKSLITDKVGLGATLENGQNSGEMVISALIAKELRNPLHIEDFYHMGIENTLTIPYGEVLGKIKTMTLFDNMPHDLGAGTSGSGKSEQFLSKLQAIQYNFRDNYDGLKIAFISPKHDTKGADFRLFEDSPHVLEYSTSMGVQRAYAHVSDYAETAMLKKTLEILLAIRTIIADMANKRIELEDIETIHIIALDEMQNLLSPDEGKSAKAKEENLIRNQIMRELRYIGEIGRSYRIHMMLCTQSPRADLMNSLKGNLSISTGKVTNKTEEGLVGFKDGVAVGLDGQGHFVHYVDSEVEYFQGFMYER
jgi:hypothetical protein